MVNKSAVNKSMDNKRSSQLSILQGSTGFPTTSESQQAEQSAGQNQQVTFSGRLTAPAQPVIPPHSAHIR